MIHDMKSQLPKLKSSLTGIALHLHNVQERLHNNVVGRRKLKHSLARVEECLKTRMDSKNLKAYEEISRKLELSNAAITRLQSEKDRTHAKAVRQGAICEEE